VTTFTMDRRGRGATVDVDRIYVGDITYIWTWEGWLYLATVIDLASRRVVGWAMADHMRAELACASSSRCSTTGSDCTRRSTT
jgi:transposase InsO family protein